MIKRRLLERFDRLAGKRDWSRRDDMRAERLRDRCLAMAAALRASEAAGTPWIWFENMAESFHVLAGGE